MTINDLNKNNFNLSSNIDFGVVEKMYEPMSMYRASNGKIGICVYFNFEYKKNVKDNFKKIRAKFIFGGEGQEDKIVLANADYVFDQMTGKDYDVMFDYFVKEFNKKLKIVVDKELKKYENNWIFNN